MLLVWLGSGIAPLLVIATVLWGCHEYQRRHEAGRIVRAIEAKDETELSMLLVERTDFHSVREWFGETALIVAIKSADSGGTAFAEAAVRLFVLHGANVNEPGTEWKTPLIHAAAIGKWELCATLLAHGADPTARDMVGRTASDSAQGEGYVRIASLLRRVES